MIFWLISGIALFVISAILVRPLWRQVQSKDKPPTDIAIFRDQLAELDREIGDGQLVGSEAAEARREIERRLLRVADARDEVDVGRDGDPRKTALAAFALFAAMPLAAFTLYLALGAGGLPDQPLHARPEAAVKASPPDPAIVKQVAEFTARITKDPSDHRGWLLLAGARLGLRRYSEAAAAFSRALTLKPNDARVLAEMGEALTLAGQNIVTSSALAVFRQAHKIDPKLGGPRFFLALHDFQSGKLQRAYNKWLEMVREIPAGPQRRLVLGHLRDVAKRLEIDLSEDLPQAEPLPPKGPVSDAISAARAMAPGKRAEFINAMVERLAARLKTESGDFAGWVQLGRSYGVLKRWDEAARAYQKALALKPGNLVALAGKAYALTRDVAPGKPLPSAALAAYRQILAKAPDHPDALWYLGWQALSDKRSQVTLSFWRKLLLQMPAGSPERRNLQEVLKALEGRVARQAKQNLEPALKPGKTP